MYKFGVVTWDLVGQSGEGIPEAFLGGVFLGGVF